MRRTYARRPRRTPSGAQTTQPPEPSPPRKRTKVYVEIVSPTKTERPRRATPHRSPPSLSATADSPERNVGAATFPPLHPEPAETPERSSQRGSASRTTTPSNHPRSDSNLARGSIVKRMLGRSRTESSLGATPSTRIPHAPTPGVQMSREASSHSLPTTFPERDPTPEDSSPKPLPTRNIKTYAGSSRSFLVAFPVPDADPLHPVEDETEPHESYADLRTRWGIDLSEDDPLPYQGEQSAAPTPLRRNHSEHSQPSLPTGMMNDLKSITELRSKGESRRFLDEVGYLFEGLDSSSAIGMRRASALEVVNKLCDLDFDRRAKTSDFYVRTWEKLLAARAGTTDKILDATITFFAALAARDPRTLTEVAQQKEFISTLVEILSLFDHSKDVLASVIANSSDDGLKSIGVLRTEITSLKSLARLVSKESPSFSVNRPSARFFVSHSLAALPPSLLADEYLPTLLTNLRAELILLEPRIDAYESGLSLFPLTSINQSAIPSLYHIEACLRLIDAYLLGHWSSSRLEYDRSPSGGILHMVGFTSELMSLCVASSSFLEQGEEEADTARGCLCSAMRVLTLLSHDDAWWCDAVLEVPHAVPFAAMTAMRSQARWSQSRDAESPNGNNAVEAFDLLCLAVALVMNWATLSPRVAVLSRMNSIDPACPGTHLCVRTCRCSNQKSVLECFTALHVQYSDNRNDEPPECAFLRGYTAILLGLLIKDDVSNQTIVVSALPGSSPSEKIKSLVGHCRSFLDLYNDTAPLLSSYSDSPRATPEAALRTHESTGPRRTTWDKRGEEIAQGVIESLEVLYV